MIIAIVGHKPDAFIQSHYVENEIKIMIDNIVCALKREHGQNLSFCTSGETGIGQWAGRSCMEHNVSFHLCLPFLPEVSSQYWTESQKNELMEQIKKARSIEIMDPIGAYNVDKQHDRDKRMVDNASLAIAFWVGRRTGSTYRVMQYALSQSKFVLNGLNDLKPIFKDDLIKGWTPPTNARNDERLEKLE